MKKDDIDSKIQERFQHLYWSIYLYNLALSELQIISDLNFNQSELQIVNSHTFNFYRVTLQYCFAMEYNKILEIGRKDNNQNISSIYQLNEIIYSLNQSSFSEKYKENKEQIEFIKSSLFYNKMKKLRDKKFAHADNHEINIPFSTKGFSTEDIYQGFSQLSILKNVLNKLTFVYDFEYDLQIPNRDNRTENFIKFHAEYKDYYFENYKSALKEKFNKKKNNS
ncbi:hypothetical protein KO566_08910 [Flavobacteriaceae bacterium XHP0103]|uniref:hypothetical protein n=1 Tax=Marixanthotalea marina TaxID=2844359 RepID=UPI002989F67A|nr:hypothetical protein [Marixanthotalea marina]MBU3822177.1 hypothetical protein [Marixanthotalea marina]